MFLAVGCLGSFTTFSTLAQDAVSMLEEGRVIQTALYAAASIGLGLLAIGGGALLGQRLL
jgi:CrcB protein